METEKKANNTMQVELTKRSLLHTSGKCLVLASITAILGMLLTGCAASTPQAEQQGQTVEQAEQQGQPEAQAEQQGRPEAQEGDSIAYTEKEAPIFKEADTGKTVGLRFYEDQPNVAYINIADYYHLFFPDKEMTIQESGTDADVYTVVNATGSATVDTAEETISSEDMAAFTNVMILTQEGMDNVYLDGAPYVRVEDTQYTPEKSLVTYDLSEYQIDIRADDRGLYLPIATLCDMYSDLVYHSAFYDGTKVYVEDTNEDNAPYMTDPDYENDNYTAVQRPADLADFTYRELCFAIDHFYGLPGRCVLNDAVAEKGLDQALTDFGPAGEETKRLIRSTDMGEYLAGMNYLNYFFYDGGHTFIFPGYMGESLMSEELKERYTAVRNDHSELEELYKGALLEFSSLSEENSGKKALRDAAYGKDVTYVKRGDTAVCVFDTFSAADINAMSDYLAGKTKELPVNGGDPIAIFLDALRQASEDEEVRNLVIDVSNNLGGSADIVAAMSAVILGDKGSSITFDSVFTGQKCREIFTVDRNFDGKFDEKDKEVDYDLRFGILISRESFSGGNLLPFTMKDNGVLVMGEKSRGGSCAVQRMATADGYMFWISSARFRMTDKNGSNIDGGIEPDVDLVEKNEDGSNKTLKMQVESAQLFGVGPQTETTTIEMNDYSEFYNIDRLSEEMNAFYGK